MPAPNGASPPDPGGLAGRLVVAVLLALSAPALAVSPEGVESGGVEPGGVDNPESQLEDVEGALKEGRERQAERARRAANLSRQISALSAETVVAARAIQDHEETLLTIERRLVALNAGAAAKRALLARRRGQLTGVLAALERIARRPPEALVVLPAAPVDTVRGAILMRAVLPPLQTRVRALGGDLAALAALRAEIARQQGELRAEAAALVEKRTQLDTLMAHKRELRGRLRADSEAAALRLARLAAEAEDLRDLVTRLGALPAAPRGAPEPAPLGERAGAAAVPPPPRPFTAAKGSLAFPARGRVVQRYGQSVAAGAKSRGLTMETRGGAQVVAPYDGQVVFAGPFRGYGQLLIIAQGEGYHILLAGLSRIDVVVGQWLLAGEPVGVLGPPGDGNSQLYVELRHNGEPINPLPWLAARDEKVSG